MNYSLFLDWIEKAITSFGDLSEWLITPIGVGDFSIAPIWIITGTGLTGFLVVALVLWAVDGVS